MKVVNQRCFLVQSDRGAVVRRNRHRLKLRCRRSEGNNSTRTMAGRLSRKKTCRSKLDKMNQKRKNYWTKLKEKLLLAREPGSGRFSGHRGEKTMTLEDKEDSVVR